MKVYRVAALAVASIVAAALVVLLIVSAEHAATDPTLPTAVPAASSPSGSNDLFVSEAEWLAVAPTRSLVVLNQLARFVCATTSTARTRDAAREVVYAQLALTRLNLDAETAGLLIERVARAACEDAWLDLPRSAELP